jgi:putative endopeptidase
MGPGLRTRLAAFVQPESHTMHPKSKVFARTALAACCLSLSAHLATAEDAKPALPGADAVLAASPKAPEPTACGDFDAFVIPANRARIGSFDTLRSANDQLLEAALAELAAAPTRQTTAGLKLLANYYSSGMDEAGIEKAGVDALTPFIFKLNQMQREDLPATLALWSRLQLGSPLSPFVGPDAKDATRNALQVYQSGLGLPDRDDYFSSDANAQRLKNAYRLYVAKLLLASGWRVADEELDALMAFETELAKASMTRVQRRDPVANYNPVTADSLKQSAPGWDWSVWQLTYTGRNTTVPMILGQPEFAKTVAQLAQSADMRTWRLYLRVRMLDATAEHLPKAFSQASYEYRDATIRGLKAPPARIEKVIVAIGGRYGNAPLAESLGELYVSKAFSPVAQQRASQMLVDIRAGMHQRLDQLPWMSGETKVLARAKLDAIAAKIGAPPKWSAYDGLTLQADAYAGNFLRINQWHNQQRVMDLDKPVDRARWNTSPHIVNAFAGSGNQIIFPAGILQPPFFDAQADDASNFGGIGMVIGHEITHHFDDRGRQFDSVGNLRDWWKPADVNAYKARADKVAALYDGFEPLPGLRINGKLTLGENISDIGGIQIAYAGLQIALKRQREAGQTIALIDGQTPEQRFFTANAIVWRGKYRMEALQDQLRTDSHSPGRYRILGPMSHMPAFAQAFNCKAGDKMVAAEPITVW